MTLLSGTNVISRVKVLIHLPDDLGDGVMFIHILSPFAWNLVFPTKGFDPDEKWLCFLDFCMLENFTHNPISMLIVGFSFAAIILLFSMYILGMGSSQNECSLC